MAKLGRLWAAIAAPPLFVASLQAAQSDERAEKKRIDQQVRKMLEAYRAALRAAGDDEEARAGALGRLANPESEEETLPSWKVCSDERILKEISACVDIPGPVRQRALEILASIDHPAAARVLAEKAGRFLDDAQLMEALVGLLDKVRWNSFWKAMGDFMEKRTGGGRPFDPGLSRITFYVVQAAKRAANPVLVDHLLRLLQRMDANRGVDGGGDSAKSLEFRNGVVEALAACAGSPPPADAAAFREWWNRNREATLKKLLRVEMWCPRTGRRWDHAARDVKARCPHHDDADAAAKDGSIEAFTTLR